jgi:3-oxoadipate enol-lactonase
MRCLVDMADIMDDRRGARGVGAQEPQTGGVPGDLLQHEERGRGPCVVLVHAGFLDRRMWASEVDALSIDFRVVTVDARGAGTSPPATGPCRSADDLQAVLDALGIERAHLVGLSMGACTVAELAVSHRERASSALLASLSFSDEVYGELRDLVDALREAFAARDRERIVATLTRTWLEGRREPAAVDPWARAAALELWDPAFVTALPHLQWSNLDELEEAGGLQVPALFVVGEHDWPDILEASQEARGRLAPEADLITVGHAAHLINLDRPARFAELVRTFIRSSA